jgi:hypothetical protein
VPVEGANRDCMSDSIGHESINRTCESVVGPVRVCRL